MNRADAPKSLNELTDFAEEHGFTVEAGHYPSIGEVHVKISREDRGSFLTAAWSLEDYSWRFRGAWLDGYGPKMTLTEAHEWVRFDEEVPEAEG